MKAFLLAIRFCLEISVLASIAAWSLHMNAAPAVRGSSAVLLCGATALVWGLFVAPNRRFELGGPARIAIEAAIFIAAALALLGIGQAGLSVGLLAIAIADRIALATSAR